MPVPHQYVPFCIVALVMPLGAFALLHDVLDRILADDDPEGSTGVKAGILGMGFPKLDRFMFHGFGFRRR